MDEEVEVERGSCLGTLAAGAFGMLDDLPLVGGSEGRGGAEESGEARTAGMGMLAYVVKLCEHFCANSSVGMTSSKEGSGWGIVSSSSS